MKNNHKALKLRLLFHDSLKANFSVLAVNITSDLHIDSVIITQQNLVSCLFKHSTEISNDSANRGKKR